MFSWFSKVYKKYSTVVLSTDEHFALLLHKDGATGIYFEIGGVIVLVSCFRKMLWTHAIYRVLSSLLHMLQTFSCFYVSDNMFIKSFNNKCSVLTKEVIAPIWVYRVDIIVIFIVLVPASCLPSKWASIYWFRKWVPSIWPTNLNWK